MGDQPVFQGMSGSLPFRQLEVFHAIISTGSVTAAARLLNVSQPSLSRSLRRLEGQLRVSLFERSRQRLLPTAEAMRLFKEVESVMRQIRVLSGSIDRILEGESALFRFGATASVSRLLAPRAIRLLTQKTPALQVFFDAVTRDQFQDYLLTGRGECGITLMDVDHPLLTAREIGTAPLVALVHRDHPLAQKISLDASDFESIEMIAFERAGPHSHAINTFLAGTSLPPRERVMVRFSEAAIALAGEGVGVALVDGFSIGTLCPPSLVVKPLHRAPQFTARLFWSRERPLSRYVGQLGDALVHAWRELGEVPPD